MAAVVASMIVYCDAALHYPVVSRLEGVKLVLLHRQPKPCSISLPLLHSPAPEAHRLHEAEASRTEGFQLLCEDFAHLHEMSLL
jgi:hypothetical protein